jgi:hypothetical protein
MPPLNLSARVRLVVYVVTGVGSALVAYLVAKDVIGDAEVTLWAAIAALVNGLAALNTTDRSTHLFLPDDRRNERGAVRLPFYGASRDRSLPGKARIRARRDRGHVGRGEGGDAPGPYTD